MRVSLSILGYEVVAVAVEVDEEVDGDLAPYEIGADTTLVDIAAWREDHDDAQVPPTVLVAGHSRRRRPRPEIVRIGTRHHQDPTPRAAAARQPVGGFGFTTNPKRRHNGRRGGEIST